MALNPETAFRDKACLLKRRFPTEEAAKAEAARREKSGMCFVKLRVYFCDFSQDVDPHWHLTKGTYRESIGAV